MISSIGIPCANTRSVQDAASPLPSMSSTITGWFRPLILVRTIQKVVEFETEVAEVRQKCSGVIQPFGSTELRLKPEGERKWKWRMLHVTPEVTLSVGENFVISNVSYRVMFEYPFEDYGFRKYEVVQDYDNRTA